MFRVYWETRKHIFLLNEMVYCYRSTWDYSRFEVFFHQHLKYYFIVFLYPFSLLQLHVILILFPFYFIYFLFINTLRIFLVVNILKFPFHLSCLDTLNHFNRSFLFIQNSQLLYFQIYPLPLIHFPILASKPVIWTTTVSSLSEN